MSTNLLNEYRERLKPFEDIKKCAFNSYNWYHEGVDELTYEVGLKIELEAKGYVVHRQEEFQVYYKGEPTDLRRRMDLVVETPKLGNVILELKALNFIEDKQRKQLWSYLRLLNNEYGMIINFGPKDVYTEIWHYDSETNKCERTSGKV